MDMKDDDDSLDKLVSEKVRERESLYPTHWPETDTVWRSLTDRRNRTKQKKYLLRIAASILMVMTAGYTFFLQGSSGDTVTQDSGYAALSSKEKSAVDFITRYCEEERNSSCNTAVITELRYDLEQSFRKLDEINNQLQVYGNDTELVRAKTRIENHQARLIKAIVQTL
jgi:hypothetical protein